MTEHTTPDSPRSEQQSDADQTLSDVQTWRRLAPIAMIYFTVKNFFKMANSLFYMLPVMAINYQKILDKPSIVAFVVLVIFSMLLIGAILHYLFYQFRIDGDRVEIKSGVFKKSHVDLPFERIQNVRLEQPLYYRFNNFVCLELDTAGSAQQEANIVALPMSIAHEYRQRIIGSHQDLNDKSGIAHNMGSGNDIVDVPSQSHTVEHADMHQSTETLLNTRSLLDLVIHGIANNRIWILLGGLAPFYNVIAENMNKVFERFGVDLVDYFSISSQQWWQFALHVMSLVMLIMLIVVSLSVLGSILTFYNYRLTQAGTRFIRRSGLLTKQETSIKLSRLQLIVCKQDWLDRVMGRINLTFEQNSTTPRANSQVQTVNKLIVPSVTSSQALALSAHAWPDNALGSVQYNAISMRFILRYVLLLGLPLITVACVLMFLDKVPLVVPLFLFGIATIISLSAWLRWYRWGFAQDAAYIYIRKGFFGVDYYCLPKFKIQQTAFKQSFLMRMSHLASAKIVLASGSQVIPFIHQSHVMQLLDDCLYKVEHKPKSWM